MFIINNKFSNQSFMLYSPYNPPEPDKITIFNIHLIFAS